MQHNQSMPQSAIIPVLEYPDIPAAADWLTRAFGFTVRLWIGTHRAQLAFSGGDVVIAEAAGMHEAPFGQSLMVRVDDVDAHCARALMAGARIVEAPGNFAYGERQYSCVDHAGHRWTFSQTIADVHPSEWGGLVDARGDRGHDAHPVASFAL